jgi:acyl dehydratase
VTVSLGEAKIGDVVVAKTFPAITRERLARYAEASGDTNPLHLDSAFAKAAGFSDVFAQGMFVMGLMAQAVTDAVPPGRLRALSTRFVSVTQAGATIACEGTVTELFEADGERRARIALVATDKKGEVKLAGEAVVAVRA